MTKRLIILAVSLSALIVGIVATGLLRMNSQVEPGEVIVYFKHPSSNDELIELTIVSRVPPRLVESRIEAHREALRSLLLKAVVLTPPDPEVVREVRREILNVLNLEGKARSIEFTVVPDLSARPRDEGIRKTLESSHS
jgi:hypothetical protein